MSKSVEQFNNTILVATNNRNKIPEIIDNLDIDCWQYNTLHELGITRIPEETGESYVENARIKARAAQSARPSMAVLADDSGIEVDALGGAPGINSARYAGETTTDQNNFLKLLDELKGIPEEKRTARFICTIVFIDEKGLEIVSEGVCEGRIANAPRGLCGFGYDPVFLPDEINDGRTMAELSAEEKNNISHRGKALRALREKLIAHYGFISGQRTPGQRASSERTSSERTQVVAFDFDGTLLEGHSPVRMVNKLVRERVIPFRVGLKILRWGIRYRLHRPVEQEEVRKHLFSSFTRFSAEEANKIMSDFYQKDLRNRLRPKALEVINKHKAAGDKVILVSASFLPILREVKSDVGADWFICTQMEVVDGHYTSNVAYLPPEGEQKLIQLAAWADAEFAGNGWELSVAYGDHRSDAPLLAAAKQAIAVNPDSALEKIALKEGWEIVDWSFKVN